MRHLYRFCNLIFAQKFLFVNGIRYVKHGLLSGSQTNVYHPNEYYRVDPCHGFAEA